MTLSRGNKGKLIVGNAIEMENICTQCAFFGCTSCRPDYPYSEEKVEKFPHIRKHMMTDACIYVTECTRYMERSKVKTKVKKPKFEFDRIQKKFVKVNK